MSILYEYDERVCAGLEKAISKPRLARYLRACNHKRELALELYKWNAALSESILFTLQMLEVCLRNTVSSSIQTVFGRNWYKQPRFDTIVSSIAKKNMQKARRTKR